MSSLHCKPVGQVTLIALEIRHYLVQHPQIPGASFIAVRGEGERSGVGQQRGQTWALSTQKELHYHRTLSAPRSMEAHRRPSELVCFGVLFFETGFLYIALAVLELVFENQACL